MTHASRDRLDKLGVARVKALLAELRSLGERLVVVEDENEQARIMFDIEDIFALLDGTKKDVGEA